VDETAAEKPFAALFDVITIGIRDGAFRGGLFRALGLHSHNRGETNQDEYGPPQKKEGATAWHDEIHLPVSEGDVVEATQKQPKCKALAHFGKKEVRDGVPPSLSTLYNLFSVVAKSY
jgi:hypothetical protein